MRVIAMAAFCFLASGRQILAAPPVSEAVTIHYQADSGIPLRVYLTSRLTKRLDEPVHAKLLEPVFSFDREIIPVGSEVTGRVSRLVPVAKYIRISAILGGDFTALREAEVEFTSITLPDGRQISFHTLESTGLNSIYSPAKAKRASQAKQKQTSGIKATIEQQAKNQIESQISGRTHGVADIVRGPNKLENLEDFVLMKLPWHPQWVRNGTRFDAPIRDTVGVGEGTIESSDLIQLGSQPAADSVVHTRLLETVTSATAKAGDKVAAVISQPLFSPERKLVLPQGTQLTGAVTRAQKGRWFHRTGQLRFAFDRIDLPEGFPQTADAARPPVTRVQAVIDSAEAGGVARLEVDQEGNVKAVESKTRLIKPAIAVLIAAKAGDDDAGHVHPNGTAESNAGGQALAGAMGFGLAGALAARSSKIVGMALGYYGLAWSVYRNIVARGAEVEFRKDAAMDIRFGAHVPAGTH
jgi:hypothetical protein